MKIVKTLTQDGKKTVRNFRIGVVWLLTAIIILLLLSIPAHSQDYINLPINPGFIDPDADEFESSIEYRKAQGEVRKRLTNARKAVADAIKGGTVNFGTDGDLYFKEYRLAQMTQSDEDSLSRLGTMRDDFLKDFFNPRLPERTRVPLIQLTLPVMQQIVEGNFHPAVRLNAVTLIGLLDETGGNFNTPPQPSGDAYQYLKKVWSDPKMPESLKVGAIAGIRRFAEISRRGSGSTVFGSDLKPDLLAIINGTATEQKKWSPDLNYWLQRRSTQILGFIGEGSDVVSALTQVMMSDSEKAGRENFWLRLDGLQSLANLNFEQFDRSQVTPLIDDVLEFTAFALERESKLIESSVDDLVYINILWGDHDLKDPDAKPRRGGAPAGGRPAGGNSGGGRDLGGIGGTGGSGGFEGGGELGGGKGGGDSGRGDNRGGGFPAGGGGGNRGVVDEDDEKPKHVDLPIYMLNDSRLRAKAVLVTARQFLKVPNAELGIVTIANAKEATRINDELLVAIDELIKTTELGVIDHKELRNAEPDDKDITFRLMNIYREGAESLRKLMTNPPVKEMAADAENTIEIGN